jgi:xanthosine utilization system XapX-like protein
LSQPAQRGEVTLVVDSERGTGQESLVALLGGRRGALDATVPGIAFVFGWLCTTRLGGDDVAPSTAVAAGCAAAVAAGLVISIMRVRRKAPPRAVLLGLLGVCVAAVVALRTGRAEDFFLLQLVSNAASALAWALSVLVRWPLLGVVVGAALGQRARWRRDPDLLRAYGRASWVWVGQYLIRLAVYAPLWAAGEVVGLGVARVALSWPLVAACLAVSWWVLRRTLPPDHPGLRHPR